jgi:hypothetical protein
MHPPHFQAASLRKKMRRHGTIAALAQSNIVKKAGKKGDSGGPGFGQ